MKNILIFLSCFSALILKAQQEFDFVKFSRPYQTLTNPTVIGNGKDFYQVGLKMDFPFRIRQFQADTLNINPTELLIFNNKEYSITSLFASFNYVVVNSTSTKISYEYLMKEDVEMLVLQVDSVFFGEQMNNAPITGKEEYFSYQYWISKKNNDIYFQMGPNTFSDNHPMILGEAKSVTGIGLIRPDMDFETVFGLNPYGNPNDPAYDYQTADYMPKTLSKFPLEGTVFWYKNNFMRTSVAENEKIDNVFFILQNKETIAITAKTAQNFTGELLNVDGKRVQKIIAQNNFSLSTSSLAKGIYVLSLKDVNNISYSKTFAVE